MPKRWRQHLPSGEKKGQHQLLACCHTLGYISWPQVPPPGRV